MTQCGANYRQNLKLHKLSCTVLDLAGSILNRMSFSLLSTGIMPVILMNGGVMHVGVSLEDNPSVHAALHALYTHELWL